MTMCTLCSTNEVTCDVFYFTEGVDDSGIKNTYIAARLCNECVRQLFMHEITIDRPDGAMTFDEMLSLI